MIEIRSITSEQTLAIRHQVLWPDYPLDFCRVPEDEQGLHLGGYIDQQLVIVASLFLSDNKMRLRKFACLPEHQSRGYGGAMLTHMRQLAKQHAAQQLWFDARESAIAFYQRHGFKVISERFFKEDVPYVKMGSAL